MVQRKKTLEQSMEILIDLRFRFDDAGEVQLVLLTDKLVRELEHRIAQRNVQKTFDMSGESVNA